MKLPVKVAATAFGLTLAGLGCGGPFGPIIDDGVPPGGGFGGSTAMDAGRPHSGGRAGTDAGVPNVGGRGPDAGTSTGGSCGDTGGSGGGGGSGGAGGHGPVPTDELIAHYTFDEGSGTTIFDSSPNKNHGMLLEGDCRVPSPIAAPTWVRGKIGGAYKFDGVNDWASIPSSESINSVGFPDGTEGVALAAWVKPNSLQSGRFRSVLSRQETARPGNTYFSLGFDQGRPMGSISHFFNAAPDPVQPGTWTHIALSYDGLISSLYVNGVFVGEMAIGVTLPSDNTPVTIGARESFNQVMQDFVDATVDEVYLYSRPLSQDEVRSVMNAGQ